MSKNHALPHRALGTACLYVFCPPPSNFPKATQQASSGTKSQPLYFSECPEEVLVDLTAQQNGVFDVVRLPSFVPYRN
jgi:hypothetical protein